MVSASYPFSHVAVIGIGLIGSSIAHAVRHKKIPVSLTLYDSSEAARVQAAELLPHAGICDSLARTVAEAQLVILAVPVGAMDSVMKDISGHLQPGAVITDTGSTKRSVIRDVDPFVPEGCSFIPGHPLAGTEFSGPAAGFASLFEQRYWLLLPNGAPEHSVSGLARFLSDLGAMVEYMDADYHDRVLAITSHLPHLIAYTIVGTAVDLEQDLKNDVIRYSASGFRDFTRIAASDPVMWRDVFLNNDEAVLEMLQRFSEDLTYLQRAIRWKEGDKLFDLFTRTRDIRRSIIDAGQD
ncbi:MAG: prephenate/arogenate dehydrogenase family protein [Pseudomonadota bacterium]|nr:prephenate/arogenate dehydrogenase family protein [Pseudomonadota bacterium]